MSFFYVKDNAHWIPEAINPELAKLAKAIVKTCHLSFKLQMKTTSLNNALKSDDKEQLFSVMQKCMAKNKSIYNQDMSLAGVKLEEVDDTFFSDKDVDFYRSQIAVLIDFAAINTVVENKMMPLMSAACQKTLNKPIDQLLFFTNQDKIYNEETAAEEDATNQDE